MIIDAQQLLSDSQAVTVSANSQNIIDLKSARKIGIGCDMSVLVTIEVAADFTTTDETYDFLVQTATDEVFTTPIEIIRRAFAGAAQVAKLAVGAKVVLPIPADQEMERYLRARYETSGTTPTVTLSASLLPTSFIQNDAYYPKGYVITING